MANPSYQSNQISMAHCPTHMHSGRYSSVQGDSILGLYGKDFFLFQNQVPSCGTPGVPSLVPEKKCSYCKKHSIANVYLGQYHLHNPLPAQITYGTRYVQGEELYRRNPYEGVFRTPCHK